METESAWPPKARPRRTMRSAALGRSIVLGAAGWLSAAVAGAGPSLAQVSPPIEINTSHVAFDLYQRTIDPKDKDLRIRIRVVNVDPQVDAPIGKLFADAGLTTHQFCLEGGRTLYLSTTVSGVHIANAPTHTPYEVVSKYCQTDKDGGWSVIASQSVIRNLSEVDSTGKRVKEIRSLMLMGLSTDPDDAIDDRKYRYPLIRVALAEGMNEDSADLDALLHGSRFMKVPEKAVWRTYITSRPFEAGLDLGGPIFLAKTLKVPPSGIRNVKYSAMIYKDVVPLSISIEALKKTGNTIFSPLQLLARVDGGNEAIVVKVDGDNKRTIASMFTPLLDPIIDEYVVIKKIFGK